MDKLIKQKVKKVKKEMPSEDWKFTMKKEKLVKKLVKLNLKFVTKKLNKPETNDEEINKVMKFLIDTDIVALCFLIENYHEEDLYRMFKMVVEKLGMDPNKIKGDDMNEIRNYTG